MSEIFTDVIMPVANVLIVAAPFAIAGLLAWAFATRFIATTPSGKGD